VKTTIAARKTRRAETIGGPARQRNEHRERKKIRGQREFQRHRVFVKIGRHRRQRGREHGAVELFHEQRSGDDERRDEVGARCANLDACGGVSRQMSLSPLKLAWP
jgi:hypothetical protein